MASVSKTLWLAVLCMLSHGVTAQAASGEYEVKAAFIHNIAKYVTWPDTAPASGRAKLCLLGGDVFGGTLESLRGKPVGDLHWELFAVNRDSRLTDCHVLFIAASERADLGRILARIEGSPVLTVGDTAGYAGQGVMVNFYLEENKVRFEINNEAATRARFRISSQLLKLARVVSSEGGGR